MSTIKDLAESYQPKNAKNITELKIIDVSSVVFEEKGKDLNNEEYTFKYIEKENERYRMPDSVFSALKAILAKKPNLKTFSVTKTGEGKSTKYTVIPLD